MSIQTVSETRLVTSQIMTPNDANFVGKVFGGTVLAMIDIHAYATASRFAGNVCVTASIDRVDFHEPIEVGELVKLVGYVSYVGCTSMEITIEISSENLLTGVVRQTNTARVTMVALKNERPIAVPRLVCETREEKLRFLEGRLRREYRNAQEKEFDQLAQAFRKANDQELDEFFKHKKLLL